MNFQKLIHDLTDRNPATGIKYMTIPEVADRVGLSVSNIHRLKNGQVKDPSFSAGYNLVKLHAETLQNEAPRG